MRDRFNKRQEEFDNLREYNDYLEEVEEIGRESRRHRVLAVFTVFTTCHSALNLNIPFRRLTPPYLRFHRSIQSGQQSRRAGNERTDRGVSRTERVDH